jgi:aminoglycoside 3-N-acetyltransferase
MGLCPGDTVLVHAALRQVGPVLGGPDSILAALRHVVGPAGTVLAYADWQGQDEIENYPDRHDDQTPFDLLTSRAARENGFWPELVRTTPGALRSANPGASIVALGARAQWFTADHRLDYGYGPGSPLGRLVEADGKVLMLGAPLDTMTLIHHAEHLADIPHRIVRYRTPMLADDQMVWSSFEEYDTSDPPGETDELPANYIGQVVEAFLATGSGARGTIGAAASVLVDARQIVPFAIAWLERHLSR